MCKPKEEGYALLLVIFAMTILSVIFINLVEVIHVNNLLVRNNLNERELRLAAESGLVRGIKKLLTDDTLSDSYDDDWTKPFSGIAGRIAYEVTIEDIGSRLNINYTSYRIISECLPWWKPSFQTELEKHGLCSELVSLREILGEDYPEAKKVLTTYGPFDLNLDRLEGISKLLRLLGVGEVHAELIVDSLEELRAEGYVFKTVDELPLHVIGMDLLTFSKLKPHLTVIPRLNINFLSDDLISAILKLSALGLELTDERLEGLLAFLRENEIKNLAQIMGFFPMRDMEVLDRYFGVRSRYFLITADADSAGKGSFTLQAVVERTSRNLVESERNREWEVKILRWLEK